MEGSLEEVKKNHSDRLGLQSNAFALSCSMALSSAQYRLGLSFSCHVGRDEHYIQCATLSVTYTPAITDIYIFFFIV